MIYFEAAIFTVLVIELVLAVQVLVGDVKVLLRSNKESDGENV